MKNTLSYKFARITSNLFVPPSFNILIFTIFAFTLETEVSKKIITILVALIFGFLLHIFLFLYFRKKGKLINLDATIKEERTVPFLIAVIFYVIGLIILISFNVNIISIAFWFCYISNTLLITLINKFWKISAHSMGAAGPASAIFYVFGYFGFIPLIISIIVGWSRIKLKCHNIYQVLAGAFLGFISTYLQIYLIVKYF